jgi:hypothetical protein
MLYAQISIKEYQRHIRPEHPVKSALAEHSINKGHDILFHHASILTPSTRHNGHIVREAIEVVLHHFDMNKEDGFYRLWMHFICSLKLSGHDAGPCTNSTSLGNLVTWSPVPKVPAYRTLSPR